MKNEVFKKDWFKEFLEIPFEDTSIKVPCGYDELLTSFYGDYMTPLPINKRKGHHYYYIDLNHSKNREEILKDNKSLFRKRKTMSMKVLMDD